MSEHISVLQQLYLSKHTIQISSNFTLSHGTVFQIGDIFCLYSYSTHHIYPTLTFDPDPNLAIGIKWEQVTHHERLDKIIDYDYVIRQCMSDPSTIDFGFEFTNGPSAGSSAGNYQAGFKINQDATVIGICGNYGAQEEVFTSIEKMIHVTKWCSTQCAFLGEFYWIRQYKGLPDILGG